MKFTAERAALSDALSLIQGIVERRNTVPILSHVLLEAKHGKVSLSATDLEIGMRTELSVETETPGMLTLNARKLFEIVREADSETITVGALDNDQAEIKAGRASFKMVTLDARSFPAMPGSEASVTERTSAGSSKQASNRGGGRGFEPGLIATMIERCLFAASQDEARYALNGICVEAPEPGRVRMVATDGHRLAMAEREIPGFHLSESVILPRKGAAEIQKLLSNYATKRSTESRSADGSSKEEAAKTAELVIGSNLAYLNLPPTELSMRLVEGEFPDYREVIPKKCRFSINVPAQSLKNAIKRAALFANERFHGVQFALKNGTLTVSSTTPGAGEAHETLELDFTGELTIGFNAFYLLQALGVLPDDATIELGLTDDVSPGLITTPADSGFRYVVMPMRL